MSVEKAAISAEVSVKARGKPVGAAKEWSFEGGN
jgi:hypothetical protein